MKLKVLNLSKSYKDVQALKDINFSLEEGVYGILGPNGSGKSTLINILTTCTMPSKGQVLWNGEDIWKMGKNYRKILGYVPQQQSLYQEFTVSEFLYYISLLKGISKKQIASEIKKVLLIVDLEEFERFKISALSGGMKQRVLIAQALIGSPQLLILDEPTVGLDIKQRYQIKQLIKRISSGKIILIATHIVSDLEDFANNIFLIEKGSLKKMDTPANLIYETCLKTNSSISSLEDVYLYYFGK